MSRSMAESEKLYEQTMYTFLNNKKAQFVIEISEAPLVEWNIFYVHSAEEMVEVRGRLIDNGSDLAGFIYFEGHYNFYYVDANFVKSQNIDSGEIVAFSDYTIQMFDITKVVEELRQLQGS